MAQNLVSITVEQVGNSWRVGVAKGPGLTPYTGHPRLLTTEADDLATQIRAAAQDCRRRNAVPKAKWP